MSEFSGFPVRPHFTPIPNVFFSMLMPHITDIAELKVTLHVFWTLYGRKGYPRYVTHTELLADPVMMSTLQHEASPADALQRGLDEAVARGVLLRLAMDRNGEVEYIYLLNTESDRHALERIESGEINLGAPVAEEQARGYEERPNIFTLYEQNIGMLSPIIADELKEAEETYPASWIEDAFREAAELNKRNWRYVSRILERWAAEGRDDGKPRRHPEAESDPEEYYRRYRHLLNR